MGLSVYIYTHTHTHRYCGWKESYLWPIYPSWWTYWYISQSSHSSMTGVTKDIVCAILSMWWCLKNPPLLLTGKNGPLPHVWWQLFNDIHFLFTIIWHWICSERPLRYQEKKPVVSLHALHFLISSKSSLICTIPPIQQTG